MSWKNRFIVAFILTLLVGTTFGSGCLGSLGESSKEWLELVPKEASVAGVIM